jgi:calcineurin-like phosphoesterase family protein
MVLASWNPFHLPTDEFERPTFLALLLHSPIKLLLYTTHTFITSLRSTPKPTNTPIRVVCISDTHTLIPNHVPPGDILIHAGDLTNSGSVASLQSQINWLCSLPHKEIIVISGNHDIYLDPRTRTSLTDNERAGTLDWKRIHYLQHRRLSLTIEPDQAPGSRTPLLDTHRRRRIRIYGAPQLPSFYAGATDGVHAFMYPRGQDAWSETIPEDTDILVTHTPPKWHADIPLPRGLGCEHLLREVRRVKPALHVFGHVHWGAGKSVVCWDKAHDAYVQGMAQESRWTRGVLNPWIWASLVRVVYRGVREVLWDRVWGGKSTCTVMVNGAQVRGNTGELGNEVQVVDI